MTKDRAALAAILRQITVAQDVCNSVMRKHPKLRRHVHQARLELADAAKIVHDLDTELASAPRLRLVPDGGDAA